MQPVHRWAWTFWEEDLKSSRKPGSYSELPDTWQAVLLPIKLSSAASSYWVEKSLETPLQCKYNFVQRQDCCFAWSLSFLWGLHADPGFGDSVPTEYRVCTHRGTREKTTKKRGDHQQRITAAELLADSNCSSSSLKTAANIGKGCSSWC